MRRLSRISTEGNEPLSRRLSPPADQGWLGYAGALEAGCHRNGVEDLADRASHQGRSS